jgi:hypothetical protein
MAGGWPPPWREVLDPLGTPSNTSLALNFPNKNDDDDDNDDNDDNNNDNNNDYNDDDNDVDVVVSK